MEQEVTEETEKKMSILVIVDREEDIDPGKRGLFFLCFLCYLLFRSLFDKTPVPAVRRSVP